MRKRVFVVSPLRGDVQKNIERARRLCLAVSIAGHAPFAPHLLMTQFLDDGVEDQRRAGIDAGIAWLVAAEEVWVAANNVQECSAGMFSEVSFAAGRGIPICWAPKEWAGL